MHPQTFITRLSRNEDNLNLDQLKEKKKKNWYADMNRETVTFIPEVKVYYPGLYSVKANYKSVEGLLSSRSSSRKISRKQSEGIIAAYQPY